MSNLEGATWHAWYSAKHNEIKLLSSKEHVIVLNFGWDGDNIENSAYVYLDVILTTSNREGE